MPNIGAPEIIIILIVLLVVVGPGKLPEIGSAFGRTLKEFRKATSDIQETASVASGHAANDDPARGRPQSGPNRLSGAASPNVLASDPDPEAVLSARDVSPRGTPADPVDEA
ncbi:MAG: sec-independent protein translocase protein TatA [Chloroflexota bacterium]|jgi:sec-independent protein translocase protein TatA|nr:sec-independent protein translocase protein TatA [Chloroflexota bacterium]